MTSVTFAPATQLLRAKPASPYAALPSQSVQLAAEQMDFQVLAQHMFPLMFRNVASDGFPFANPVSPGQFWTGVRYRRAVLSRQPARSRPGLRIQLDARRGHHRDGDRGRRAAGQGRWRR